MTAIPSSASTYLDRLNVSRESRLALRTYVDLLLAWQKRFNLIGPSTVDDVWDRHILDSAQLIPLLPHPTTCIAELGSGAGLPGLVLAIITGAETHLYESNGKKIAFLKEAVRLTKANAVIHATRLETLDQDTPLPKVQCVVARALAPLPLLLDYGFPFLDTGAIGLFHKGQDVDLELTEAAKYWRLQFVKHPSLTDSRGVILEIREARRV